MNEIEERKKNKKTGKSWSTRFKFIWLNNLPCDRETLNSVALLCQKLIIYSHDI